MLQKITEINLAFEVLSDPKGRKYMTTSDLRKTTIKVVKKQSPVNETPQEETPQIEIKETNFQEQSESISPKKKNYVSLQINCSSNVEIYPIKYQLHSITRKQLQIFLLSFILIDPLVKLIRIRGHGGSVMVP